ncbi:MAG: hypothetical protein K0R19_2936 [Bacillota bacterium]|jgi:fluoroquinolone transport system permease protein|nr:hypothetical protein [Bacillota bacterium]
MRAKSLFLGDIRFQIRYGFYFLYLFLSVLYITVLYLLPITWREPGAILMIFSDPAAMGLYFMGAIVLFEKSERVLNSIAVSPVRPLEYVISKLGSVGLISTAAAVAIGMSGQVISNPFQFAAAVFLCSCLFSAAGLIIACKITTLNQFIIATIPAELLINLPAVAWLFGYRKSWLLLHPGVCMMKLCSSGSFSAPALLLLICWTTAFTCYAVSTVSKMLKSVGGINL